MLTATPLLPSHLAVALGQLGSDEVPMDAFHSVEKLLRALVNTLVVPELSLLTMIEMF
jgi:hypothetical protein